MNDLEKNSSGHEKEREAGLERGAYAPEPSSSHGPGIGAAENSSHESEPSVDDWTMAALAHASIMLTLALTTAGGVGALVGLVVPLVIYLSYQEKSRFVAFHALQALVYQGAAVLIYLVLVIALALAVTVAWTVAGLLSAVIVGFFLMPLALAITILMVVILLGAPLAWAAYGLYAAYEVYQGSDFRYGLVGEWVEREVRI